jgi:ABC-2 type transport system permease protein
MSRVRRLARADFARLVRQRRVWVATLLLGLAFLPSLPAVATPERRPIAETLLVIPLDMLTYTLVVVAAVGYGAFGADRGTLRATVTLAGTRRAVLVGRLCARLVAAALVVAAVLAVGNVVVATNYGRPYLLAYWTMAAWLLVYVGVWTAVATGYAAAFGSSLRAVVALAATYALFSPTVGLWDLLVRPVAAFAATGSPTVPSYEVLVRAPLWLRVTERLNPLRTLYAALRWSVRTVGPGTSAGGPLPHVAGVGVLVGFAALPLLVGLRRFERADLAAAPDRPLHVRVGARLVRALGRAAGAVTAALLRVAARPTGATARGRVRLLARADLRRVTGRWLPVAGVVVALAVTAPSLARTATSTVFDTATQLTRIPGVFRLGVLVLGLAVGVRAVAGGIATGTVHRRLVTGARRREVVAAAICARGLVVVGVVVPLWLLAELLVVTRLGRVYPGAFLAGLAATLVFAGVWLAVVLGASAATRSSYRALGVAFGAFLLFDTGFGLWATLVRPGLNALATGAFEPFLDGTYDLPAWLLLADRLNPFVAVDTVETGLYAAAGYDVGLVPPWWLTAFASVAVAAAVIGPLAVGVWRFERRDLG